MRRASWFNILLVLCATSATAGTFEPTPFLAEQGIDVLTRQTANEMVNRDLFGAPWATAVVGHVDVYEGFPYLESRWFQIVTDPQWGRLLLGEVGQGLGAFDGAGSTFGPLSSPHGLSTDGYSRVFVADTGNNRVLAFNVITEFDQMELVPAFAVTGLSSPFDVAFSDAGTPFEPDDDLIYVANSGRNEVVSYRLTTDQAQLLDRVGSLGSGDGAFAGPMAITVGRHNGAHTNDIYVSDAHNGRVVQLTDNRGSLEWTRSLPHDLGLVSSLDTDHWGNVYAAAPQAGVVAKFTPQMMPIAQLSTGIDRPRSVHVPFVRITDHRTGEVRGAGQGSALVVEQWDGDSGLRMLTLGVELSEVAVVPAEHTRFEFTVSDHSTVRAEILDHDGHVVARMAGQELDAGRHELEFTADDFVALTEAGDHQLRVTAVSSYDDQLTAQSDLNFAMSGSGGTNLPTRPIALGNSPNPFNPTTMIRFLAPGGTNPEYHLGVYDTAGRLVRNLGTGRATPGLNEVLWNGQDDRGSFVGSGVYYSRLELAGERLVSKMVLVK